jgi:acyl carrier protein
MTNIEKYTEAFKMSFDNENLIFEDLEYQSINEWDSIGHLFLTSNIEEMFGITFEIDDVTDLSSFKKGIEILKKYDLEF